MSSIELPGGSVLFEDAHLFVVDKPVGMPAQQDRTGDVCVLDLVQRHFPLLDIGLPHRLDRPVSGALILTKHKDALRAMNDVFRTGGINKTYLAIVEGRTPERGTCRHQVEHASGTRKAQVSEATDDDQGTAELSYTTRAMGDRFSLLEVRPTGGAFHQIRAQLAAIGHPIKGDVKYGARRGEQDRSIALHAWRLDLQHPMTRARLQLVAPDPVRSIWPALLAL